VPAFGGAGPGMVTEVNDEATGPGPGEAKPKKRRTVSPTADMVAEWRRMSEGGMSLGQIAAASKGYDRSTIGKRLKKELARDGGNGGAN